MRCPVCKKRSQNADDFEHVWKTNDSPSQVPGRDAATQGVTGGKQLHVCPGCLAKLPHGWKKVEKPAAGFVPKWIERRLKKPKTKNKEA